MACNPCPCGEYSAALPGNQCTCSQQQRHHYSRKVTGPVHDRIDILRHVLPPTKPGAHPRSPASAARDLARGARSRGAGP